MNEEFDKEFPDEVPDDKAQNEAQKSEPNRTMGVFLTVYQIIITMIVLSWTWNI